MNKFLISSCAITYLTVLSEGSCLERVRKQVYALEEILVEKIVALTDLARNEPRDLYDVWYLTAVENMDLTALIPKIASKLEFRDKALAKIGDEFVKKEARLRKLWQFRLANQMADLTHFDEVYRAVRRSLRVAGLMKW
ncbi:MAG: nucleotidyl transferase AbiEii/AbiGii toxin family protein [Deltaproteobacteria bacterium]|nr:nucleotidyl transferase AbiEii/AbiGii toxin family protein [Deltaproteobacteria bacterium]